MYADDIKTVTLLQSFSLSQLSLRQRGYLLEKTDFGIYQAAEI